MWWPQTLKWFSTHSPHWFIIFRPHEKQAGSQARQRRPGEEPKQGRRKEEGSLHKIRSASVPVTAAAIAMQMRTRTRCDAKLMKPRNRHVCWCGVEFLPRTVQVCEPCSAYPRASSDNSGNLAALALDRHRCWQVPGGCRIASFRKLARQQSN